MIYRELCLRENLIREWVTSNQSLTIVVEMIHVTSQFGDLCENVAFLVTLFE